RRALRQIWSAAENLSDSSALLALLIATDTQISPYQDRNAQFETLRRTIRDYLRSTLIFLSTHNEDRKLALPQQYFHLYAAAQCQFQNTETDLFQRPMDQRQP